MTHPEPLRSTLWWLERMIISFWTLWPLLPPLRELSELAALLCIPSILYTWTDHTFLCSTCITCFDLSHRSMSSMRAKTTYSPFLFPSCFPPPSLTSSLALARCLAHNRCITNVSSVREKWMDEDSHKLRSKLSSRLRHFESERWLYCTVMGHITFWSRMDHIYSGGPQKL